MTKLKIDKKLLRDGVTLLLLSGELDAHTAPSFNALIADLFRANSARIIIDMRNLAYISSHGIGVLVGAQSRAMERKGSIVLMSPAPMVQEIFAMLEVSSIFSIVNDREAALEVFAPRIQQ